MGAAATWVYCGHRVENVILIVVKNYAF